jgi:hypothetical protein
VLTQDRIQREILEGYEKAWRDAASWLRYIQRAQEQVAGCQQESEEARQQWEEACQELEKGRLQAEQRVREAEQGYRRAEQRFSTGGSEGYAKGHAEGVWLGRVQAYEECLGRPPRPEAEPAAMSVEQLRELTEQLRGELAKG